MPLEALQEQCNTTSATNAHVVLQLEHAQSLLSQFSEGLAEISPWLEETQNLIGQLSLGTISYEAFREQQDLLQVEETCPFELSVFNKEAIYSSETTNTFQWSKEPFAQAQFISVIYLMTGYLLPLP